VDSVIQWLVESKADLIPDQLRPCKLRLKYLLRNPEGKYFHDGRLRSAAPTDELDVAK
jgi:hypothetical protein